MPWLERLFGTRPARRAARVVMVALCAAALGGCASTSLTSMFEEEEAPKQDKTAAQLYAEGDALLDESDWKEAAKKFEEVDKNFPYSPEARQSIVMSAYANYKQGNKPKAVSAARRYLTLHPGTDEAPLAQHIIASSYFERMNGPDRDQSDTEKALNELEVLVRRYPDSRYAPQARKRVKIARDLLAAKEMNVGRYYLEEGNYIAAINRFRTVVEKYQQTAHVEEALSRLTEAYMALGIKSEAQTAAAVLGHNFPESEWYEDAYALLESDGLEPRADAGSWISRQWRKLQQSSPI
jgi:outer membrane protein assembly factor BamD